MHSYLVLIALLFIVPGTFVNGQVVPAHRIADWSVSGANYDFSANQGSYIDVKSFGASGDGISDDFQAVLNAVNSFGGSRGTLYFPAGTYIINGSISLPDSITLIGESSGSTVLLFNAGENNHAIKISGVSTGSFIPVLSGYQKNSNQLIISDASTFANGDMAELIQDGHQHMTSSWAMESLGQMLVVDSVSGNTLFLNQPIRMDYDSLLAPRLRRVNPRRAVSIECLKIERADQTNSSTANIGFFYAYNCRVFGVESRFCNFAHVDIRVSSNITVRSSYFHEGHNYGSGGKAYGVCVNATSGSCLVENNIFRKLRHSILLQSGANGNVFAFNYSTEPHWTDVSLPANSAGDIVLHGNYPYLNLFEGNIVQNIVIDDSHGKNGHHNTFFRNRAELYGIFMNNNPATDSVNFIGNEVTNTGALMGLYYLNGQNHFQSGNNIRGTITPAGTGTLPDTGIFYNQAPSFWNIPDNFPAIGPPNAIGGSTIPARTRFLSGSGLATCNDTDAVNYIAEITPQKDKIEIIRCAYNTSQQRFEMLINFEDSESRVVIELFNLMGVRLAAESLTPVPGLNYFVIPTGNGISTMGLYIVRVRQGEILKSKKVLISSGS